MIDHSLLCFPGGFSISMSLYCRASDDGIRDLLSRSSLVDIYAPITRASSGIFDGGGFPRLCISYKFRIVCLTCRFALSFFLRVQSPT